MRSAVRWTDARRADNDAPPLDRRRARHDRRAERFGDVTESATGTGRRPRAVRRPRRSSTARSPAAAPAATVGLELDHASAARCCSRSASSSHTHRDELAAIVTREHGKVLVRRAAARSSAGWRSSSSPAALGEMLKGEITPGVSGGVDSYSLRQPRRRRGRHHAVQLPDHGRRCGCTRSRSRAATRSSSSPPSRTRRPSLRVAELWTRGRPARRRLQRRPRRQGGGRRAAHPPGVDAVSFVGSTPIARYVHETGTAHGKRVQALGGAKNHAVVLPDADLELAADGLVSAGYGSAGQRCMAVSVAVAVGDIADPLLDADPRADRRSSTSATGTDAGVGHGAARLRAPPRARGRPTSTPAWTRARRWSSTAATSPSRGARAATSSARRCSTACKPGMTIYDEEIFGPVLVVVRADSYPEALALVNANPYGNGAAIFTNDGGAARAFEQDVTAGMVGVNVPIPVPMAYHSFGGWKAVAVRRPPHPRPRGRALLHARQGRHAPLARPVTPRRRSRLPRVELGTEPLLAPQELPQVRQCGARLAVRVDERRVPATRRAAPLVQVDAADAGADAVELREDELRRIGRVGDAARDLERRAVVARRRGRRSR